MKIRHPLAIRSSAFLLSLWLRSWVSTLEIQETFEEVGAHPRYSNRQVIYTLWHENLVIPAAIYTRFGVSSLISEHRDGELIAQIIGFMGGKAVRGSSTRGGERAIRDVLARLGSSHLAITPDGPRGPRRAMQIGAVYLASRLGVEVVPVGLHVDRAWRMRSWDRMAIPKPFSRVDIAMGIAVRVPPNLSRQDLEPYRVLCEQRLQEAQSLAERRSAAAHSRI